jgi:hypothetical protein
MLGHGRSLMAKRVRCEYRRCSAQASENDDASCDYRKRLAPLFFRMLLVACALLARPVDNDPNQLCQSVISTATHLHRVFEEHVRK